MKKKTETFAQKLHGFFTTQMLIGIIGGLASVLVWRLIRSLGGF